MPTANCPKCQRPLMENARFCTTCGSQSPVESVATTLACHKCRSALKPGAKFCTNCGVVLPDLCECGSAISPTARFCTSCGKPRPEDAQPLFDMSQFADFEDDMVCKSCGYRGRMPVLNRSQSNSNPMAGSVVISPSVARHLRYQFISSLVDTVTTTDHVHLVCPNCRKRLHWEN